MTLTSRKEGRERREDGGIGGKGGGLVKGRERGRGRRCR